MGNASILKVSLQNKQEMFVVTKIHSVNFGVARFEKNFTTWRDTDMTI